LTLYYATAGNQGRVGGDPRLLAVRQRCGLQLSAESSQLTAHSSELTAHSSRPDTELAESGNASSCRWEK